MAPDDIPAYLSPLLSHALEHIPPSMHAKTPIYVLATAGMRLLSDERQLAILRATCDTLRRDYPFLVDDESGAGPCGDSVRIISGEEEGIWGWVAVNYLMDGFGHAPDKDHVDGQTEHDHLLPLPSVAHPAHGSRNDGLTPVDVHHHSPTFGFLDMGGASTQLAFSPTDEELAKSQFPRSDLASVSLRLLSGEIVQWPVFAASWLQFGTNKARERYVDAVVKQHSGSEHITDACLPIGLRIPTLDKSKHPDFIGGGNFSECLTSLKPLLKQDAPCPAQHCLFGGLATPHIDFHRQDQRGFIGVSEYWYTANQVLGLGGVWDWAEWERSMNDFCSQDWKHIEEKLKSGERGSDVCTSGSVADNRLSCRDCRCSALKAHGSRMSCTKALAFHDLSTLAGMTLLPAGNWATPTPKQSGERGRRVLLAKNRISRVWTRWTILRFHGHLEKSSLKHLKLSLRLDHYQDIPGLYRIASATSLSPCGDTSSSAPL